MRGKLGPVFRGVRVQMGEVGGHEYIAWITDDMESLCEWQVLNMFRFRVRVGDEVHVFCFHQSCETTIGLPIDRAMRDFEGETKMKADLHQDGVGPSRRAFMMTEESTKGKSAVGWHRSGSRSKEVRQCVRGS